MIGLITKDFLVFNRKFNKFYKLLCAIVLIGVILLLPENSAMYIGLLLPAVGVSFLAELIKVEEKSDWKDYLPALPLLSHEIVLSRYLFCSILLAALSFISLISCMIAPLIGGITLIEAMSYFILGVWFAVLMLSFGVPCGYFFKNEMSTGAMIGACVVIGIIRNTGADMLLFKLDSFVIYAVVILFTIFMVYASYRISLWIYTKRRYAK
jgi:hypothetical protein